MTDYQTKLEGAAKDLRSAIEHLAISHKKVLKLSANPKELSVDALESWEAFSSRFARAGDLFTARYLRTFVLSSDPGFRGAMRDFFDQAEKLELIESAEDWMLIRELRNRIAHTYASEKLEALFLELREQAPLLIHLQDKLI